MEIEIRVFSSGVEIEKIRRPLVLKNGALSVNYLGDVYPVLSKNKIEIKQAQIIKDAAIKQYITQNSTHGDCGFREPSANASKQIDDIVKDKAIKDGIKYDETSRNKEPTPQNKPKLQSSLFTATDWDRSQRCVIEYDPDARIIVQAGPGTGKTAVACARVAYLNEQRNIEASNIWIISFTRTAVQEIRNRIRGYLQHVDNVHAIKIATIDSHAWAVHSGFDENARILGKYEDNIEKLLNLLKNDNDVSDFLEESVEHLIIDEAQDIVGVRADLILEIIKKLSNNCGITIFADDAQAIYGFAMDEDHRTDQGKQLTLSEKIREMKFKQLEMDTVHRTKSPTLKTIFSKIRKKVLTPAENDQNKLSDIKKGIEELADESICNINDLQYEELKDSFILFRRRADVLQQSSFFADQPHRIRMSGIPICIHPWIGACFSEYTSPTLNRRMFAQLWQEKSKNLPLASINEETAWQNLIRVAGESDVSISMKMLRNHLGRGVPPPDFCITEIGSQGPIIGTIHASKGREAEKVYLMLPPYIGKDTDHDEESRVVFVGATRAQKKLIVGRGYALSADRLDRTGRTYSLKTSSNKPRAQFEVGRDGDIKALGIAGREYFSIKEIHERQNALLNMIGTINDAYAENDHGCGHVYRLKVSETRLDVAVLSEIVGKDLFGIGEHLKHNIRDGKNRRPPDRLDHLKILGIRTLILPADSQDCEKLHSPWNKSGIMLAPVLFGYTTAHFPFYFKRRF